MDHKIFFIFIVITASTSGSKKEYNGYKVYEVTPRTEADMFVLNNVQKFGVVEMWDEAFFVNGTSKVIVSQENEEIFLSQLKSAELQPVLVHEDLQKIINDQRKPAPRSMRYGLDQFVGMSWDRYYSLEQVYAWLDELELNYKEVRTVSWGRSNEDRIMKGIIINYHPERSEKLIAVIEGTIHAREWISAATITWIIKEFLTSDDPVIRGLAENFEWHILPVSNPDGYSYTFTHNRLWRKNRNFIYAKECDNSTNENDISNGVDLNRNFGFQWMGPGAENDSCSNMFAGASGFSEPETRAIVNYVTALSNEGEFIYYLAFHSYSQLVINPYSHLENLDNLNEIADNYADLYEIGVKAAHALEQRYGTSYKVGISQDTLNYPMSGTSFDWVKNSLNVPITYLLELRDTGTFGFLLPPEQIIPNNLEVMDFIKEMDIGVRRLGYYKQTSAASSIISSIAIIVLGVSVCLNI